LPHEAETIFFRKEEKIILPKLVIYFASRGKIDKFRKNIFSRTMSSVWSKITNSGKITKELDNE